MSDKKDKVLVTGGAGFIGSALVWALNEQGVDDIVICDALASDEKWKNLVPLRYADYIDAEDLLGAVEFGDDLGGVTKVFHLGACSATTETDAGYLMRNNFEYTKRLAHWALERDARFVYASSAATYGDGSQGMDDVDENLDRLRPLNMYGYSKHLFDLYAQRSGILDQIVGLKYFNVYGPNEAHKEDMRSVVDKAFGQIQETGEVKLFKSYHPDYEDGKQMRDFHYVKDAVKMTLFLSDQTDANGLYNIGSGVANTWIDLVKAIFEALGQEEKIEFIDMPETLKEKYQYYTKADIGKLQSVGYKEDVTLLKDAVADYVQNYLAAGKLLGE